MLKVFSGTYTEYKKRTARPYSPFQKLPFLFIACAAQPELPPRQKTHSRNQRQQIPKKLNALERDSRPGARKALQRSKFANPRRPRQKRRNWQKLQKQKEDWSPFCEGKLCNQLGRTAVKSLRSRDEALSDDILILRSG